MASPRAGALATLRLRRADLIVRDPWPTVMRFFVEDPSSKGVRSYDAYVIGGSSPPNEVVDADVTAINVTMGARSPHEDWAALISRGVIPELVALSKGL